MSTKDSIHELFVLLDREERWRQRLDHLRLVSETPDDTFTRIVDFAWEHMCQECRGTGIFYGRTCRACNGSGEKA